MSIDVYILLMLLLTHFVADFVLQTDRMAKGKSSSNTILAYHVGVYSLCFIWVSIPFVLVTFVLHFITDWCSSRLSSMLWKKGDVHNFFVVIGADQLLHYVGLILCYVWLVG